MLGRLVPLSTATNDLEGISYLYMIERTEPLVTSGHVNSYRDHRLLPLK